MSIDTAAVFTRNTLDTLFPPERSDQFFDALFGDATEGAYDIVLEFSGSSAAHTLNFELHLKQRPGKCLACNLTYGLPEVFSRHPLLNIAGVAAQVATLLEHPAEKVEWNLGQTQSRGSDLHIIPLTINLT